MKVKRRRSSSSFSDDDQPLITMKTRHDDHNSYVSLCRHKKQLCEFCDMVFENRYRRIIHNMKHIIIPLLNLKVYQCNECLHHFTSHRDLIDHTQRKHPKEKLPETQLVKKHQNVIQTETNPIIIDLTLPNEDYSQLPSKSDLVPRENSIESGSIKSRLLFEDDLLDNSDKLLNNFTINCQVKLESFEVKTELKMNNDVCERNGDDYAQTVHYDDLLKPGVFRCKKCGKRFPARYEAIIHEASHITFKNARVTLCGTCNEYIVGNGKALMLHYLANHKQRPKDNTQKKTQPNLIMLGNNPLKTYTSYSNKEEITKKVLIFEEEEVTSYSKTLMLCDLCLSFCKSGNSRNYVCVGSVNELGKRYPCSKCGSLFFEVNLVKQSINLRRHSDVKKVRKKTSNEVRLKHIQNRFKLLKN